MNLRRDSYGLKYSGSADHVCGSGEAKVVRAWLNWLGSSTRDSGHELGNVSCFSRGYSLESCDLIGAKTEGLEIAIRELCEALLVEG